MNKKLSRIVAGALSVMFVGQVMIYGDGSSRWYRSCGNNCRDKGILAASENADELAQVYENAVEGLGEVEYFGSPEAGITAYSAELSDEVSFATGLTITGKVQKGCCQRSYRIG